MLRASRCLDGTAVTFLRRMWGDAEPSVGHDPRKNAAPGPVCGWDPRACCRVASPGPGEAVSRCHAHSTCFVPLFGKQCPMVSASTPADRTGASTLWVVTSTMWDVEAAAETDSTGRIPW